MSSEYLDKTGLNTLWAKIKSTFQTLGNLVTAWGSTPSDTKYPSEKLVKDSLDAKAPNAPSGVTIANGDKIVITDASDSNKVKRASVAFDGSTVRTFLTQKGTFGRVLYADEAWGGAFRTSLSPVDTYLMIQRNCFFGPKLSAITVEYSTDGGTTWLDYGLTDSQKYALFSQYNTSLICFCGKNTHIQPGYTGSISGTKDLSDENIADQRLRITICCESRANAGTSATTDKWIYANIRRIGIYASTNSASKGPRHCVFTARKKPDFRAGNDTWVNFGDFAIAGDSGWNSIPCNNSEAESGITFGDSYDTQYCEFRFEIWSDGLNVSPAATQTGNMGIGRVVAFSELCWTLSSLNPNLGNTGLPCTVEPSTGVSNFTKGIKSGVAIPIASGGTGKASVTSGNYLVGNGTSALTEKTPKQVGNNVLPALDAGPDNVLDTDYIIASNHAGGATDATAFVRRTAGKLWNYIKDKISSVLGLTATSYGGNAATATTATTAAGYTSGGAIDTALQGKQDDLGVSSSGSTTKFLNEKGQWATPAGTGAKEKSYYVSDSSKGVKFATTTVTDNDATAYGVFQFTRLQIGTGIKTLSGSADRPIVGIVQIFHRTNSSGETVASNVMARITIFQSDFTGEIRIYYQINGTSVDWYIATTTDQKFVAWSMLKLLSRGTVNDIDLSGVNDVSALTENNASYKTPLVAAASTGTGSETNPVYVDGTGRVQACNFDETCKSITQLGQSGTGYDTTTTAINSTHILQATANSYVINIKRLKVGLVYKFMFLEGSNSGQVYLCNGNGSNFSYASGPNGGTTKKLSLNGGAHGSSYTSYVIRDGDTSVYHIWGY